MTPKKLTCALLVFICSLIVTGSSYSQIPSIGIKGGLSVANVSGYPTDTDNKTGFALYAFMDILNLPFISVGGEAGYVQKGFNLPVVLTDPQGNPTGSYDIKNEIGYVDISVIGKVKLAGKTAVPYLLAGPTFGVKTSASSKAVGGSGPVDGDLKTLVDNYKSTSIGGTFGLGIEVPTPALIKIMAEARYGIDFSNSYESTPFNLKNKGFEFLIGVAF